MRPSHNVRLLQPGREHVTLIGRRHHPGNIEPEPLPEPPPSAPVARRRGMRPFSFSPATAAALLAAGLCWLLVSTGLALAVLLFCLILAGIVGLIRGPAR